MLDLNRTSPLFAPASVPSLPASAWHDPYLLADRAFDLAEAGALAAGRKLAEQAFALDPCSPDAAHALVHVFCEERDWIGGGSFLRSWLRGYPTGAPEASHLACHLAQFELWSGQIEAARAVLHERLDPRRAPRVRLRDAAAVLWRLHLAGEEGLPWHVARPLAEAVLADPSCPLDATHAALLLAGQGDRDGMARLVRGLRQRGAEGDRTAARVVLPLVLGIGAFAAGRFVDAVRLLALAPARLMELEGSNVQRAIFSETATAGSRLRRAQRPDHVGNVGDPVTIHPAVLCLRKRSARSLRPEISGHAHDRAAYVPGGRAMSSKRSRFITLFHAATKSRTNFSLESSHA